MPILCACETGAKPGGGITVQHVTAEQAQRDFLHLVELVAAEGPLTITRDGASVAVLTPWRPANRAGADEAIRALRAFRRSHPLRGLAIRDLIDDRVCPAR
jgi:prevent-host-death family protein